MKTVYRYVLKEILPTFFLCLAILTFLLMTNKIFLLLELVLSKNVPFLDTFALYLNLLPYVLSMTIPMSMMVATLLAFGRLGSDMEVTAFKCVGVHPFRLIAPVLAFGFFLMLLLLFFNDRVLPSSHFAYNQNAFNILRRQANVTIQERVFIDNFEGNKFYIDRRERDGTFSDVKVFNRWSPKSPLLTSLAKTGKIETNQETYQVFFQLGNGVMTWDNANYNTYNRLYFERYIIQLKLGKQLDKPSTAKRNFEDMHFSELSSEIKKTTDPKQKTILTIEYQKRLALPFACLILAWFCSPLGLWAKAKGFMAFVLGIVMIFVYYLMFMLGQSLSHRGAVDPILGLWGGNLLFTLVGCLLYYVVVMEHSAFKTGHPSSVLRPPRTPESGQRGTDA